MKKHPGGGERGGAGLVSGGGRGRDLERALGAPCYSRVEKAVSLDVLPSGTVIVGSLSQGLYVFRPRL